MTKIFLFLIALLGLTVISFFIYIPIFYFLFGIQLLAIALWFLIGCYNVIVRDSIGYRNYTILKGFHGIIGRFFIPIFYFNTEKYIRKQFVFNENCRYNSNEITCINKLFGISFGWHHKNSIRFGWKYDSTDDKIHIFSYVYKNGQYITPREIAIVNIGQLYTFKLKYVSNSINVFISLTIYCNHTDEIIGTDVVLYPKLIPRWGYKLYPYFGGTFKAPHTIKIKEVY